MTELIRVLLVEDNPADAELVRALLATDDRRNYDVHVEQRLADAAAEVNNAPPDVVLLDLTLPDSGGANTLHEFRSGFGDLPVIIFTIGDDDAAAHSAMAAGAQDYLVKNNINSDSLSRSIRYAIARQRLVSELRRKDAAMREFIALAAHELRTPLTVLAGAAETLVDRWDGASQPDLAPVVEALDRQANRAQRLARDLLDLSRIERGDAPVALVDVQTAEVVEHALEAAPPYPDKDVVSRVNRGLWVRAEPQRLEQVLVNLLMNAYRYGGANIALTSDLRDGFVELEVADDGPGIPEALGDRVFEPFVRGHESRDGSGLGLTIAARLVETFGGRLSYEGSPQEGARFSIRLPSSPPARPTT